ncbi:flagellin hook IN motif-containing protein [Methylobacterium sp. Leaf113]|uniref:flagellin hook IN motif-containing protein n=1 Tax=Methylobacterium sp. Leaf113 TaxID=1736259 RepID=UPI0012E742B9
MKQTPLADVIRSAAIALEVPQTLTINNTAITIPPSASLDDAIKAINLQSTTTGVTASKNSLGGPSSCSPGAPTARPSAYRARPATPSAFQRPPRRSPEPSTRPPPRS